MAKGSHKFQAPKGTRDFYPDEMAVRRYIEGAWRAVSIGHGFDEIEGPNFEHLEVYTAKSGPGIVSELFSFRRSGGDTDYALRPEFTPTLARMAAARSANLPVPTKWFSIPVHFRAERPQRGRLREFVQWNVDVIGDATPAADAEVIAVAIGLLERLGLTREQVGVRLSHRGLVGGLLEGGGVPSDNLTAAFELLDRRDKMKPEDFQEKARELGLSDELVTRFTETRLIALADVDSLAAGDSVAMDDFRELCRLLDESGLAPWCGIDLGIVRGLAYYTGTVFEVHDAVDKERAVAGGGRYDQLIETFGGKPTPAVGFAMGDVVIRLLLEKHGLLDEPADYLPRPDVFVIATADEAAQKQLRPLVAELRRSGLHVRHSYKSTKNIGKLLGEAGKLRSRHAVILDAQCEQGQAQLKNLETGTQQQTPIQTLPQTLQLPNPG
ncbi:MAG: histidine--tRNA ligase [Planctomycetota bacterium]